MTHSAPSISTRKRLLFICVILFCCSCVFLVAAELYSRAQQTKIVKSDRLDSGMIGYDRDLGWRLVPGWKGRHRHHDFDVSYATNAYGFRSAHMGDGSKAGLFTYALLGDSFSYGLGVNDQGTFAFLLNASDTKGIRYLNFSIPGYSTNQEYLLMEKRIFAFSPDAVLLMVYLGNDIFDNALPFPLQAENAKPYYALIEQELVLKHSRYR